MKDQTHSECLAELSRETTYWGIPGQPFIEKSGSHASCGDHLTLYLQNDKNGRLYYTAESCSLVKASAAALTNLLNRFSFSDRQEILNISHEFLGCLRLDAPTSIDNFIEQRLSSLQVSSEELEQIKLQLHALASIQGFPVRLKCVKLPWRVLEELLQEKAN